MPVSYFFFDTFLSSDDMEGRGAHARSPVGVREVSDLGRADKLALDVKRRALWRRVSSSVM